MGLYEPFFDGVESEVLMSSLSDIAFSTGSACNSANPAPSHVLTAMGLKREDANRSLRLRIGRFTTMEEIDYVIAHIEEQVKRLREASPLWEAAKQSALQKTNSDKL